jgi:CubicO group peptidase (beta-lactamase class C family)
MAARRRTAVLASALALAGTVLVPAGPAAADGSSYLGRFDRPEDGFMPERTVLTAAEPADVRLDPDQIDALIDAAASYTEPLPGAAHPLYSGAVVLAAHGGSVVAHEASGWSLRYADTAGAELPADEWIETRTDTIYDLASVSKLFTTIVVLQQVEAGLVALDTPVATYLPAFGSNGKESITVRQLLTHTTGLPAWLPLWRDWPTPEARIAAVLDAAPTSTPGTRYVYSDLNMITAGLVAEQVTGRSLDELVAAGITEPLGMVDTMYNPPAELRDRIAATEYQATPPRGMVHGEVHDENAWSLGGVAGHAGVFGTAADLARLAQAILNGGVYDGARILETATVESMLTNENTEFPGNAHGLGFELDQMWYMDALASPSSAGHTGYTGTSLVIDPHSRSFVILLSNRVHPSRSWGSINPARRAVAHRLAMAMTVAPAKGHSAWTAHEGGATTSTLGLSVRLPDRAKLTFDLFVDTESTDPLVLEASADGGQTWRPVPFSAESPDGTTLDASAGRISGAHDREWWTAVADLSGLTGEATLRWRYVTDAYYEGRGVFVDGVQVRDGERVLFEGEAGDDAFEANGWTLTSR